MAIRRSLRLLRRSNLPIPDLAVWPNLELSHHANPNKIGKDPDVESGAISFVDEGAATRSGVRAWIMGGLNYQIEHHLFPSMPRPHLRAARTLVREHCRSNDVPYVETTLVSSYRTVIGYLNRVGLAARDPFDCGLASQLRPR